MLQIKPKNIIEKKSTFFYITILKVVYKGRLLIFLWIKCIIISLVLIFKFYKINQKYEKSHVGFEFITYRFLVNTLNDSVILLDDFKITVNFDIDSISQCGHVPYLLKLN